MTPSPIPPPPRLLSCVSFTFLPPFLPSPLPISKHSPLLLVLCLLPSPQPLPTRLRLTSWLLTLLCPPTPARSPPPPSSVSSPPLLSSKPGLHATSDTDKLPARSKNHWILISLLQTYFTITRNPASPTDNHQILSVSYLIRHLQTSVKTNMNDLPTLPQSPIPHLFLLGLASPVSL